MATLLDNFTGSAGTVLSAHTADSGHTWSDVLGNSGQVLSDANRVRGSLLSTPQPFLSSFVASGPDVVLTWTVRIVAIPAAAQFLGIIWRLIMPDFSGYSADVLPFTNSFSLGRFDQTVESEIG